MAVSRSRQTQAPIGTPCPCNHATNSAPSIAPLKPDGLERTQVGKRYLSGIDKMSAVVHGCGVSPPTYINTMSVSGPALVGHAESFIVLSVILCHSLCAQIFQFCTVTRSEEHTSELQSPCNLVCRLLLEK